MTDLLGIGATGVRAYQTALSVVGENISNASTPGYVRRDPTLKELSAGAGNYVLQINKGVQVGGVDAPGVSRQWDSFRAADVRVSTADASRTSTSVDWLGRIEQTLSSNDIAGAMTKFFNAGQALAADPTGTAPRAAFLDSANGVATAVNGASASLDKISGDLADTAQLTVKQLNSLAASLATANAGLAKVASGSNAQAQLLDQRDQLLDQMSQLASISVETADNGVATVRFNAANGPLFVDGPLTKPVTYAFNASGTLALTVDPSGNPQALALQGGSLAGLVDSSTAIAGLKSQVANLAANFAASVNQVHQNGVDLDGNPGQALFTANSDAAPLTVNPLSTRQVAAARPWTVTANAANASSATLSVATAGGGTPLSSTRISLSGGVLTATDPVTGSVIGTASYTVGTPVQVAGLSITVTGAPVDGDSFTVRATGAGSRDNGNLADLSSLRQAGGFETGASDMVSANATALSAKKGVLDAQNAIHDGAVSARDAASGVNLDSEAVDLMRFQQAYQASGRVIQVARDIFQTIIDIR